MFAFFLPPEIRNVDWNKEPPGIILPPRKWSSSRYDRVKAHYLVISKTRAFSGGGQDGEVYWGSGDILARFINLSGVDHIYERNTDGRYYLISHNATEVCKDCKGSGEYVGFTEKGICRACKGDGYV